MVSMRVLNRLIETNSYYFFAPNNNSNGRYQMVITSVVNCEEGEPNRRDKPFGRQRNESTDNFRRTTTVNEHTHTHTHTQHTHMIAYSFTKIA
jgi:hypothetical protein